MAYTTQLYELITEAKINLEDEPNPSSEFPSIGSFRHNASCNCRCPWPIFIPCVCVFFSFILVDHPMWF